MGKGTAVALLTYGGSRRSGLVWEIENDSDVVASRKIWAGVGPRRWARGCAAGRLAALMEVRLRRANTDYGEASIGAKGCVYRVGIFASFHTVPGTALASSYIFFRAYFRR